MGTRMTVLAAVATGVLAAPCGGIAPAIVQGVRNEVQQAKAEALNEVSDPVTVLKKAEGALVEIGECKKLDVEPTIKEEYALGSALAIHWAQRGGGLMLDAKEPRGSPRWKLHAYLNTVGRNLGAQSPRPTLQWTFGVLEDREAFNAVSAPGGYVFVTRRLLEGVDNEGQLAGVLAHEIAHIVLKHAIHQYNSAKVTMCQLAAGGGALPFVGPAIRTALDSGGGNLDLDGDVNLLGAVAEKTIELFDKGNSREQELEADALAVRLMLSAGYDPREYSRLISKTAEGGGVLSNHPSKKDRLAHITQTLDELTDGQEGEFQELTTEGLRAPPLGPELTAVIRPNMAKDQP